MNLTQEAFDKLRADLDDLAFQLAELRGANAEAHAELEERIAAVRESAEIHDERRQNETSRLRQDLDEEIRERQDGQYSLENRISSVERTAEQAQRTAENASYSRGGGWGR